VVDPLASRELLKNHSFFSRRSGGIYVNILANRFFRSVSEQPFCALFNCNDAIQTLLTIASCDDSTIAAADGWPALPLALGDIRRATHKLH